ncbi:MAG: hypothetical protein FWE01_00565 [Firmicutes bacterium]|nr:hypothetical protein [Bacillota bacterium]
MELKLIKRLAELMNSEGLKQLELTTDAGSIWLERDSSVTVVDTTSIRAKVPESVDQRVLIKKVTKPGKKTTVKEIKVMSGKCYEIRSPIEGIFYAATEPTDPPYVTIGQTVSDGDLLCVIGEDGVMNELESEVDGEVSEILVSNGQKITFDQVLFKITKKG